MMIGATSSSCHHAIAKATTTATTSTTTTSTTTTTTTMHGGDVHDIVSHGGRNTEVPRYLTGHGGGRKITSNHLVICF